jgi:hypothetical protein
MRLLGLAIAVLACAPSAHAASVAVQDERLVFTGTPPRHSSVSVDDEVAAGWFDVRDLDVPAAGERCRQTVDSSGYPLVRCDRAGVRSVEVQLGPRDDAAAVRTELPVHMRGGGGRDILALPLSGSVEGQTGGDCFELDPGYAGRADVDGGPAADTFRLLAEGPVQGSAEEGWTVSLANGSAAYPGSANGITFRAVEDVFGSRRADSIEGDDGANSLSGWVGPDSLAGLDGPDRLDAIDHFVVEAHPVADEYVYTTDAIGCGGGADRLLADPKDRWAADCERVLVHRRAMVTKPGDAHDSATMLHFRTVLNGDDGANRMIGSARVPNRALARGGDDRIVGGARRDTIDAGAGDDRVAPRPGRDRVDTGAGDDAVDAAEGTRDVIRCGDGTDNVTADRRDRVAADCEHVALRWNW